MNTKRAIIDGGSSRMHMIIQDKRDKIDKIINSHNTAASVGAKISDILASQIMKGSKTSSHNP
jgi:predicted transcriptional regulator YheO